jgi:hypothetical protein
MALDNKLVYVKWMQKLAASNYIVQSGETDPATGRRARLLFLPINEMIARIRRCDFILLVKHYGPKVRQLDPSEVPDHVRAVFEKREAKEASAAAATKKPKARKATPKKAATKKPKANKSGKGE